MGLPLVFETFRDIGTFEVNNLKQEDPSCFNGMVRVRKYRVTVERLDEPDEVVIARLRKLWAECNNHHHRAPLLAAAKALGLDLYEKEADHG